MTKQSTDQLAIFGGTPAFREKLHVGRPNVGNRENLLARFNDILDRRWFTNNGQYVQEFEQRIARIAGVEHCIAVCNATIGLELLTRALGLTGEVIIPSFTFVATAHALQWQEITPVFCDIDPRTHMLDVERVEMMITPRTSGIIGVHLWGNTCDVEELSVIARRRNLALLFDAAHAFGCSHKGQMVGSFGEAEVFSFHATKFLNSFEGGAIATNNGALAEKIRLMRNFGFHGFDNVIYIGTNGKMSEVSAAMGITSLEDMDEFIDCNRRNYELYQHSLGAIPGIHLMEYDGGEKSNYQYIVITVDARQSGLTRDMLVDILMAENVVARKYFFPGTHRMEPYRSYYPHSGLMLPETEKLAERVMLLPTGTGVSSDDIATIGNVMRCAIHNAADVRNRIERNGGNESTEHVGTQLSGKVKT